MKVYQIQTESIFNSLTGSHTKKLMIPPDNPLSIEFPISETLKDIYHVNFA